jgi:hypothetical protein
MASVMLSATPFAGGRSLWRRHSASLTLALKLQRRRMAADGSRNMIPDWPSFDSALDDQLNQKVFIIPDTPFTF